MRPWERHDPIEPRPGGDGFLKTSAAKLAREYRAHRTPLVALALLTLTVGVAAAAVSHRNGKSLSPNCAPNRACMMMGDQRVERNTVVEPAGRAAAFRFLTARSGDASSLRVFIPRAGRARFVLVGLYSDARGNPGRLLSSGSIARPKRGAWNAIAMLDTHLAAHHQYWLAILGKKGRLSFRARPSGPCASQTSRQQHLAALPQKWSTGTHLGMCPISAFVIAGRIVITSPPPASGTAPTSSPTSPSGGGGSSGAGAGDVGATTPTYTPAPCTSTIGPGADIQGALRSAAPGAVVCLASGSYGSSELDLSNIAPSGNIILEAAPGATVNVPWVNMGNNNHNLTIQGLFLNGGVGETGSASDLVFQFNTISGNNGAGSGFYFYANGGTQNNIQMVSNQLDHLAPSDLGPTGAGQCLTVAGGSGTEHNFTFSHNVCGPGIANHYTQAGGVDGLIEDGNTFLGPAAAEALSKQEHNNVLQIFGDSDNIDFSHNVVRDSDSRGQEILFEEGKLSSVTMNNNLFVGDPMCLTNSNCFSYAVALCASNGLQFNSNTVVGYHWGIQLTNSEGGSTGCLARGTGYTITHNIVVGTNNNSDMTYAECSSQCSFDYNVTDDGSAAQPVSTHFVKNWKPSWTDSTSYLPVGLPFSAGYGS
jgi:hypothetical protein